MSTRRVVRWDTVNHPSGPICHVGTLDDGTVFVALDLPQPTEKPLGDLEEMVISNLMGQTLRTPTGVAAAVEVGQQHQDESTPDGLTVSADGSLLNWNGVNYVPQVPADEHEAYPEVGDLDRDEQGLNATQRSAVEHLHRLTGFEGQTR